MYQTIYRKYRPQKFAHLYGQDAISKTLNNAISKDKLAHAYLFSGPRGTGKTTTAKLIAKALNCTNMVDGKICDECENCRLIKQGMHPDVVEIDAASNNGVDEVRDLIEKVKYAPMEGKKKVYIIDEIHMMSQGAFNALLKTLEEPPDHVVFILATTEFHKVLDTIKSRCQKFIFKKISNHDIVAYMQEVLKQEEATYEEDALYKIASLSDGGMRDALSLLEQVMIYNNNKITLKGVYEALSLVAEDKISQLYDLVLEQSLNEALDYINNLSKSSIDFKQVISDLLDVSVNNLVKNKDNKENHRNAFLLDLIENLDEALNKLRFDNSKQLYLELAIIKSINREQKRAQQVVQIQTQAIPKPVKQPATVSIDPVIKSETRLKPKPVVEPHPELAQENMDNLLKDQSQEVKPVIPEKPTEVNNKVKPEPLPDKPPFAPQMMEVYVTPEELMNVLVNADLKELEQAKQDWKKIEQYLFNVNTKKYASLLNDGEPVASSHDALIIVSDDKNANDLINAGDNLGPIARFIEDFSEHKKYCFALTRQAWMELKGRYIKLRKENNLPESRPVLPSYVEKIFQSNEEKLEETDLLVFGKKVFKDALIIKKEDEINEY